MLIEGRKRQIRRALTALGHPVRELLRVRMGPLSLAGLACGAARELSAPERAALLALRRRAEARRRGSRDPSDAQAGGTSTRKREPGQGNRKARARTRARVRI